MVVNTIKNRSLYPLIQLIGKRMLPDRQGLPEMKLQKALETNRYICRALEIAGPENVKPLRY